MREPALAFPSVVGRQQAQGNEEHVRRDVLEADGDDGGHRGQDAHNITN
jgi:hypothetical protein